MGPPMVDVLTTLSGGTTRVTVSAVAEARLAQTSRKSSLMCSRFFIQGNVESDHHTVGSVVPAR